MENNMEQILNQNVIFLIQRLQEEAEEKRKEEKRRMLKMGSIDRLRKIQRDRELLRQKTKELSR